MHIAKRPNTSDSTVWNHAGFSIARGFATPSIALSWNAFGSVRELREMAAITKADNHPTQAHRRDGRWPSGNSSTTKVAIRPIAGAHIHPTSALTSAGAGSDP